MRLVKLAIEVATTHAERARGHAACSSGPIRRASEAARVTLDDILALRRRLDVSALPAAPPPVERPPKVDQ